MPILQMRQLRVWLGVTQSAARVGSYSFLGFEGPGLGGRAGGTPSHTVLLTHEGILAFCSELRDGSDMLWKELQENPSSATCLWHDLGQSSPSEPWFLCQEKGNDWYFPDPLYRLKVLMPTECWAPCSPA